VEPDPLIPPLRWIDDHKVGLKRLAGWTLAVLWLGIAAAIGWYVTAQIMTGPYICPPIKESS
jgi:hypothetical protein